MKVFAQSMTIGGQQIEGPLKNITKLSDIINVLIPVIMGLAALILFFVLVWGGIEFLTSQGSDEGIKKAKAKITTGLIGFILLIVSYIAVRMISAIFGLGTGLF